MNTEAGEWDDILMKGHSDVEIVRKRNERDCISEGSKEQLNGLKKVKVQLFVLQT